MHEHNSFFGFLNLFSLKPIKNIKAKTAYPAINHNPRSTDIIKNLNLSDLGLFICYNIVHSVLIFHFIRKNQRKISIKDLLKDHTYFNNEFRNQLIIGGSFSLSFIFLNSYTRLKGLTNNGLKWKFRDSTAYDAYDPNDSNDANEDC